MTDKRSSQPTPAPRTPIHHGYQPTPAPTGSGGGEARLAPPPPSQGSSQKN